MGSRWGGGRRGNSDINEALEDKSGLYLVALQGRWM